MVVPDIAAKCKATAAVTVLLLVGSWASVGADTIVAPGAADLSCVRKQTTETGGLSVSYTASTAGCEITVAAAVGTGTPVAGATLSIKGGEILTYGAGLLMIGSTPAAAKTLEAGLPSGGGAVSDLYLQLDSSGVAAGAAGLDTAWTYTLTYTLSGL